MPWRLVHDHTMRFQSSLASANASVQDGRGGSRRLAQLDERLTQEIGHVAQHESALGSLRRQAVGRDVHHHDVLGPDRRREFIGSHVAYAGAEAEEGIAFLESLVRHHVPAPEADASQAQRVSLRYGSPAVARGDNRQRKRLHELDQVRRGMRVGHPSPGQDQRQPGRADHLQCRFHVCPTDGWRSIGGQLHSLNVYLRLLSPDILRDLDQHRPASAAHSGAVRLGEDAGYLGGRFDAEGALAQRRKQAPVVHLQHAVAFHQTAFHRSGDDHHRRGVFVGVAGGDHGVEGTRPRVHQDHPRPAGQPPLGVGHAGGHLLVAAGDVSYLVTHFVERIDEGHVGCADDAIEPGGAHLEEGARQRLCSGQLLTHESPPCL